MRMKEILLMEDTLLVTATDGNHGYGVAYIAKLFKCRSKVRPEDSSPTEFSVCRF